MGSCMSLVTVLENRTDETLELREREAGTPEGIRRDPILIHPHESKWIRADKFRQHSEDSTRPRDLILDGVGEKGKTFSTEHFITFEKFVFIGEKGNIEVQTFPAEGTVIRRIKLVKCLISFFQAP